ncbi:hypothetical protein Pcac1_g28977 [Phytophthora cactorum]|uniref:Uncharacterized protein n=1 Tax=Phytophthora cactorum TaxID=29920 RepID=A0A8T0YHY2_9STRA|nr:hypothetical protein Pcac1_g28977 [Phytophthora cactorum]KAG2806921.1 hypothetical protein PC111_g17168 [Phytophthora cactorum]KAG2807130.1 hypothetical protein PC112_g17544 [Phytophthora cactorum]KAG2847225.1 hypothetical protein PC113_g17830 [Phytophthora cactorum]KAG2983259.1 hypothetical protein PC119_g20650 [Phytophthora cactorum]
MKNAEFVNLLYKNATATEGTCSFCNRVVKQKKQAGYKNLITHLQDFHNGYETVAEECVKNNCEPLSSMFVHKDAADTYGWTKLVALKTFPFTHVDDPIIRYAIRYKAMDRATLLKRMVALVGVVDTNSAEKLAGEKFALVFDGLTDSAEHAIAFFAATKQGLRFLAFLPFQDESSMTAAEHIDFLDMWIPATSVAVERFFSTVKSTVGYLRKSMSQENLEVIIFLTLNWDLVTLAVVSKAIQESRSSTDAEQE